jgi:hypothetical protein
MSATELWTESYQGEVLGEALFGWLADREENPERKYQLQMLTLLERATKELAEPVFERRGIPRGDTEGTVAAAVELARGVSDLPWEDFMAGIIPVTVEFLGKYRQLVALAPDAVERQVAEAYVNHEEALASFARRASRQEAGDPVELILALPHVAAAASEESTVSP